MTACTVSCIAFVCKYISLEFTFCFVMFCFFLLKKLANWCRCFYDSKNYCILRHVIRCAVRNFVFLYLLCALIFGIACTIPALPYFLQCFCELLVSYFRSVPHLLQILSYTGLCRCHLLLFRNFPCYVLLRLVLRAF